MKYMSRRIADPYAGRGITLSAKSNKASYDITASIGLSDKLIAFALEATPWFDFRAINEGEERPDDNCLHMLELTFQLLFVKISLGLGRATGWLANVGEVCVCGQCDEEEVPPRPSLSLI